VNPVAFPWPHEPTERFTIGQRWSTEILTAYDESEQRISRRGIPDTSIEFTVRSMDATQTAAMQNALQLHRGDLWAVPLWPYAARTSAALYGGETTIPCAKPEPGCGLDVLPWKIAPEQRKAWLMLVGLDGRYSIMEMTGLQREKGWTNSWAQSWGLAPELVPLSPLLLNICVPGGVSWGSLWNRSWGISASTTALYAAGSLVVPCRLGRLDPELHGSSSGLDVVDATYCWTVEEEIS